MANDNMTPLQKYVDLELLFVKGMGSRIRCVSGVEATDPSSNYPASDLCLARLEKSTLAFRKKYADDFVTMQSYTYQPYGQIAKGKGLEGINTADVILNFILHQARGKHAQSTGRVEEPIKPYTTAMGVGNDPRSLVADDATLKMIPWTALDAGFTREINDIANTGAPRQPSMTLEQVQSAAASCMAQQATFLQCAEVGKSYARIVDNNTPVARNPRVVSK